MRRLTFAALVVCLLLSAAVQADEARLLRYPDIHGDKVVFSYAGDLWLVSSQGGVARRLTSHPGIEQFAKFSPDGSHIAFTGIYDGNTDVFVMPTEGGEPKRLTYHPVPDIVLDWYPDGKHVLFRSTRNSPVPKYNRLFKVSIDGGYPEELPPPTAELSALNGDATKLAYNRMGREFRTWKRYRGGRAPEIWTYDLAANRSENLTSNPANDTFPMWYSGTIYFISDRNVAKDGRLKYQLFSLNPATKEVKQLTDMPDYDVLWPSMGDGKVIFENGGWLYTYDIAGGNTQKLNVELYDDKRFARAAVKNVQGYIHNYDISPTGKRALFEARGEIFTVPEEKGEIRQITHTPGIRERSPVWSPNGKWIAYFSDKTGEYQIYIRMADGTGEEQQITSDIKTYFANLTWSPDSKMIAFSDVTDTYYYVDIESKEVTKVFHDNENGTGNYVNGSWSPDSKWLTYHRSDPNGFRSVYLYNLAEKKEHRITDSLTDDNSPAFDPDGKYLYWVANRAYNPTFSAFEFNYIHINPSRIAVATLKSDAPSPFAPESDEEAVKEEKKEDKGDEKKADDKKDEKKTEGGDKEKKEEDKGIEIDIDGLASRMISLPIPDGNHLAVLPIKGNVLYASAVPGQPGFSIHMFDMKKRESKPVISGIFGAALSFDGKKIIYQQGRSYGIIKAAPGQKPGSGRLNLGGLTMEVDYKTEWKQIYWEAWRQARDYFYDPNHHGLDWKAIGDRYAELLPYVAHRADLNFLIGEMIGELNSSHTYRGGGEYPNVTNVNTGLLGALIVPDNGYYKIAQIYEGENNNQNRLGPLTQPGLNVTEGMYIVAVMGNEIKSTENFYNRFVNTAGKTITISVNDKPGMEGAREIQVTPTGNDAQLRYMHWMYANVEKVNKATGGKVGYVYVPDTAFGGMEYFNKMFYGQLDKEGLIVDARWNSGGFIPDIYLERLARRLLSVWKTRYTNGFRTPGSAHYGPKVCITNGWAGSGGDAFPYYFKKLGLGPVIGERSWGGLIGISGNPPLMDNGRLSIADFSFVNTDGEFDVENHGVDPDITVVNTPHEVAAGHDLQLDRAIAEVMRMIEQQTEKPVPDMPATNPVR